MIPKVIHYCWLSDDPLPKSIVECINSWKKHMPDYQIKRWSTQNFNIHSVKLVEEAYEQRKWAFATDYIRLYALYHEGGVYLDSDVFLHKNIEPLLQASFVSGIEYNPADTVLFQKSTNPDGYRNNDFKQVPGAGIQAAFAASIPKHPFILKCLESYKSISLTDIIDNNLLAPTMQALCAEEFGFRYVNEKQTLANDMILYPTSVIGQNKYETKNRYATHRCAGSWEKSSLKHSIIDLLNNRFHFLPHLYSLKHFFKK